MLCTYRTQRLETGFDNHQTMTLDIAAVVGVRNLVAKLKQSLHQDCTVKVGLTSGAMAC